jgi:hypothetical protein
MEVEITGHAKMRMMERRGWIGLTARRKVEEAINAPQRMPLWAYRKALITSRLYPNSKVAYRDGTVFAFKSEGERLVLTTVMTVEDEYGCRRLSPAGWGRRG